MSQPLSGLRVIELAGIGPGPYAGELLADLGAEVIVIDRPAPSPVERDHAVERRGKRSMVLDLRQPEGAAALLDLAATADALIEGYRPGVTERLGIGPEEVRARNPRLVYGRMTGWGQEGPWSKTAGHDINYISVTGLLHAMGDADRPPPPPLNMVGDYGGGSMFLLVGVLAALLKAKETGEGAVVDAAICDGAFSMSAILHSLTAGGRWREDRQSNMLDGGAPYYRCYACADGLFMAVGCIEPQFFAEFQKLLGIDPEAFGPQNDPREWPRQHRELEAIFASQPRDHWAAVFDGSDACTTPVLKLSEAPGHPHMAARRAQIEGQGLTQPGPAPRFAGDPPMETPPAIGRRGDQTEALLREIGRGEDDLKRLAEAGVTGRPAPATQS
jgi:alpha-methylacyl-CoA racemase